MQRFRETTDLVKRVQVTSGGDGIRDTWIEEGLDTGFVTLETSLHDKLVDLDTGNETIIHNGESNLIVVGFGLLVASLLKGDATFGFPLTFWAVGEGEGSFWDGLSVEVRQGKSIFSLTELYDEIAREPVVVIFIDENDAEVIPGPTNRVEVRAVFGPTVTGTLREFGIFGGDATTTLDSGIMIDHKSHTAINLNNTPGQQNVLIRALRITL